MLKIILISAFCFELCFFSGLAGTASAASYDVLGRMTAGDSVNEAIAIVVRDREELYALRGSSSLSEPVFLEPGAQPNDARRHPNDATQRPNNAAYHINDATLRPNNALLRPNDATVRPNNANYRPNSFYHVR